MKIKQILPQEHKFTEVLGTIALIPKMLYFYEKLPDFDQDRPKCVAIVGTRKMTKYGEEVAYKLAYDLAKQGITIISGLAYGIDSTAHRGALDAGGTTIAVLGTEITNIYPKSHHDLAKQIIKQNGAIISEYAPQSPPPSFKTSFLYRNRLISGLSDAVIVVEAAAQSGSLNTAMHAIEQGRELFAVPGDITRPLSTGTNGLLRTGAHPCTCADDVLGVICPKQMKQLKFDVFGDTTLEQNILQCLKSGTRDGSAIMETLNISSSEFSSTITLLEIKGLVRPLGSNLWSLK